jgi:hypothetical protein
MTYEVHGCWGDSSGAVDTPPVASCSYFSPVGGGGSVKSSSHGSREDSL